MPSSVGPAIMAAAGGRFLARGGTAKIYEAGIDQRTVLIEFDSVAQAIAAHDSQATRLHSRPWAMRLKGTSVSLKASTEQFTQSPVAKTWGIQTRSSFG